MTFWRRGNGDKANANLRGFEESTPILPPRCANRIVFCDCQVLQPRMRAKTPQPQVQLYFARPIAHVGFGMLRSTLSRLSHPAPNERQSKTPKLPDILRPDLLIWQGSLSMKSYCADPQGIEL
jgi:hypothetical protein